MTSEPRTVKRQNLMCYASDQRQICWDVACMWFVATWLRCTRIPEEGLTQQNQLRQVMSQNHLIKQNLMHSQIVAHMLMHEHQHTTWSWLWQTKLADAVEMFWQLHSRKAAEQVRRKSTTQWLDQPCTTRARSNINKSPHNGTTKQANKILCQHLCKQFLSATSINWNPLTMQVATAIYGCTRVLYQ